MPVAAGILKVKGGQVVSALLEGILYGVSLPMFGATVWVLWTKSQRRPNLKMLVATCLFFIFSTMHLVLYIIKVLGGLGASLVAYFSDQSQWQSILQSYLYVAQTLLGDAILVYRCYVVWQSKWIMILPVLLWCTVAATGVGFTYSAELSVNASHSRSHSQWVTAFWASMLAANLLTTTLLAVRIWHVKQKAIQPSPLRHILQVLVDAGIIYSVFLIATEICLFCGFQYQYVLANMIVPIISITFYMVIIRVGLAGQRRGSSNSGQVGRSTHETSLEQGNRMRVRITTFTEDNMENGRRLSISSVSEGNNEAALRGVKPGEEKQCFPPPATTPERVSPSP